MSAQTLFQGFKLPPVSERDCEDIERGEYDLPLTFTPQSVLDIGAHVGLFTHWARTRWPGCKITAVEPWRENIEMFKENINGDPNVILHEAAAWPGDRFEITEGLNSFCNSGCVTGTDWTLPNGQVRNVPALIPRGEFDYLKMDCEGAELEVLKAMDLSSVKAASVEVHNATLARSVDALMEERGFERIIKKYHGFRDVALHKYARPGTCQKLPQKLMVAIPVYGEMCAYSMQCLIKLINNPPLQMCVNNQIGDSLVSRARNSLTNQFLKSDCTDLLFIDSDLIFSPEQVGRICSHDVDVVGGLYPKKQDKPEVEWVLNTHRDLPAKRPDGLQKVAYIGTGFIRVRRHVFEKMIEHYGDAIAFKDDCTDAIQHDIWPVGVYHYTDATARYLSEDWYFCQRWMDLGGEIYADTKIVLKHVGTAIFPTKTQEAAMIAAGAEVK